MPALDLADIATKALFTEGGVAYVFGTKKEALAFRARFYTFKAKELRHQRRLGSQTTPYDPLGCFFEQTPEGWLLTIKKALINGEGWFEAKSGEAIKWPGGGSTPPETPEPKRDPLWDKYLNQGN